MRLNLTDRKNICQTLKNVREMLSPQQVIDLEELALWDLIGLEGHVEPDYPGSREIFHALSYAIHLKRLRAGLGDEMPSEDEGDDYVEHYFKQFPLESKYDAFVSLLDKAISLQRHFIEVG